MRRTINLISWRVGAYAAGLLALVLVMCVVKPQGTAAKSHPKGSFCGLSSASDVAERVGETKGASGIKLVVSDKRAQPGDVVKARLLNFDDEVVGYGAEFRIQGWGSDGWETDPSSPSGPWRKSLAKLQPGAAGSCYRFAVPADQHAGRYRFLTSIASGAKQMRRAAEFRVW